jgi:hypothetical protein
MQRSLVWLKYTDVSEVRTASIISVMSVPTLHGTVLQMATIFEISYFVHSKVI